MLKIDIFGSCVTRDAFRGLEDSKFIVNEYFARTSIVSQYSKPLAIKLDDINLSSAFQKRMVYRDITKGFPQYINKSSADYLLIDFIDERLGILNSRQTYITRSTEFIKSQLNLRGTLLSPEERMNLWKQSALHFIEDITNKFPQENIILHKAFWKQHYRDKAGNIKQFDNPDIDKNNQYLREYYDYIKYHVPKINEIHIEEYIADENHIWGIAPFHYEEDYYVRFNELLEEITQKNSNTTIS